MRSLLLGAAGLGIAAIPSRAALQDALIAQRLLADIADARVVKIERREQDVTATRYGVAFAFEHCLWIYTAEAGTRVLGPGGKTLPEPKTITGLLERYDPALTDVTVYRQTSAPAVQGEQWELNRACVVSSIITLAQLLQANDDVKEAALILLSYSSSRDDVRNGMSVDHCVLVTRNSEHEWRMVDGRLNKSRAIGRVVVGEPVNEALMALLRTDYPLQAARLLPIEAGTLGRISASALWRAFSADLLHGSAGVRLPR